MQARGKTTGQKLVAPAIGCWNPAPSDSAASLYRILEKQSQLVINAQIGKT
jgi:hypothetical protein